MTGKSRGTFRMRKKGHINCGRFRTLNVIDGTAGAVLSRVWLAASRGPTVNRGAHARGVAGRVRT
jgi:hypothetical protein